ncbi:phospholipase A2 inhibitor and Ly6/PLAUR domain-containing protein [Anarrhichthys ocellatus]|uniref:phospholipase A2 inhibitor and Ly6/PLAUR domain-containing protein n=1 Tax=Anarrhichthys ocellatus TaxID=433405 RepID=UPI0012EE9539|nr:phospholipase A2 inhibitor and Ly6/PLAUR domain-containing protein [Anarrhichthys ocellatus]
MKTVILALLVLVVVSQGEALRCNCGGTARCSQRVETCSGNNPVCASIILQAGSNVSYFKRCMKENDCRLLLISHSASGFCCSTDLCN